MSYIKIKYIDLVFYIIISILLSVIVLLKYIVPFIIKYKNNSDSNNIYYKLKKNSYWKVFFEYIESLYIPLQTKYNEQEPFKNKLIEKNKLINKLEKENEEIKQDIISIKESIPIEYNNVTQTYELSNTKFLTEHLNSNSLYENKQNDNIMSESQINVKDNTITDNLAFFEDKELLKILKKKNNNFKY